MRGRDLLWAAGGVGVGLLLGMLLFGSSSESPESPVPAAPAASASAPPGHTAPPTLPAGAASTAGAPSPEAPEAGPAPWTGEQQRFWLEGMRERLREAYREETGEEYPPDLLAKAEDRIRRYLEGMPTWIHLSHAQTDAKFEAFRRLTGVLADPAEIVLQARGSSMRVDALARGGSLAKHISPQPLDLAEPAGKPGMYVQGGIVPDGMRLVITRVEVRARLGRMGPVDDRTGLPRIYPADLEVNLPRVREVLEMDRVTGEFRAVLSGRTLVDRNEEDGIGLTVSDGAAEARVFGRLVDCEEARKLTEIPFRLVPAESRGFFDGGPVTLQILGSNGTTDLSLGQERSGRVHRMSADPIWDGGAEIDRVRDSVGYHSGLPPLPPGKAFRLTRIEYRARLLDDEKRGRRSKLEITMKGEKVAEHSGDVNPNPSGVWTGDVTLEERHLRKVQLEVEGFGLAEAVFHGELVEKNR